MTEPTISDDLPEQSADTKPSKKPRKRRKAGGSAPPPAEGRRWMLREIVVIATIPFIIYLFACLFSYHPEDAGWSHAGSVTNVGMTHNFGGKFGAYLADVLLYLFGYAAYFLPILFAVGVWDTLFGDRASEKQLTPALRLLGAALLIIGISTLGEIRFFNHGGNLPEGAGGVIGQVIAGGLVRGIGMLGSSLLLLVVLLVALTLAVGISWFKVMDQIGKLVLGLGRFFGQSAQKARDWQEVSAIKQQREEVRKKHEARQQERAPIRIEPAIMKPVEKSERARREQQIPLFSGMGGEGDLPPLSLLDEPGVQEAGYSEEALHTLSRQIEFKLKDFRIDTEVVDVFPGPVITRFELEPAPGVKGSQIGNLDKDIARGLSVRSVRVVDVIPGKSVIGLEIPNEKRAIIYLSEILRSKEYDKMSSPLTLALGKDIGGKPKVADLAKMPHLLVAGTTGSGKSVAVNAMILSLLYKSTPEQVRLLMIDPKMLELSVYEGIPHLLAPVVTDMKEAANGLRWCVAEMERRYKLMSAAGVRNLAGFNRKVKEAHDAGQPMLDPLYKAPPDSTEPPPQLETLPAIVVIVDEFADMMMIVGKKVEELIARLAQKARAAGIHLILATQRPSVDVITGLIKANVPTRIAFQVSSKIDSRTIIDQGGAEALLGNGDMLFVPPGTSMPERLHGAFVSDGEVHQVVEYLRERYGDENYIDGVLDDVQTMGDGTVVGPTGLPEEDAGENAEIDELYDQAVAIVTESRRASISNLQRRLRIGYNRSARMIEAMQMAGVVSAPQNNGERTVLAPPPPRD